MNRIGSPEPDAWHEAGHAVMAHILGGSVACVTLEDEDDRYQGRVTIEWPPMSSAELATASARVALAGPLIELIRLAPTDPADVQLVAAWEADWAEVERCAAVVAPDPERRSDVISRWAADVHATLENPRTDELVARVADALDAHETLDEALFWDCLR